MKTEPQDRPTLATDRQRNVSFDIPTSHYEQLQSQNIDAPDVYEVTSLIKNVNNNSTRSASCEDLLDHQQRGVAESEHHEASVEEDGTMQSDNFSGHLYQELQTDELNKPSQYETVTTGEKVTNEDGDFHLHFGSTLAYEPAAVTTVVSNGAKQSDSWPKNQYQELIIGSITKTSMYEPVSEGASVKAKSTPADTSTPGRKMSNLSGIQ